ncbi:ShKT domain-containing protein [Strongyloides ratti]|uniref:ShKT domain-containing protein n=1 Tax=Strongyloides ratti TaxID=34506 RepID=A0A090MXS9_STRRB|nr:ShKT domain-containing protein [Strongyloides ratti]CEF65964.1 ShKT domain-containing protein [Strongyloides ratti]
MHYFTFWTIVFIYLIIVPVTESGNSKICDANTPCDAGLVCLKDITRGLDSSTGNFCGQPCTPLTVANDCGAGETCDQIKDITDADTLSCVKSVFCLTDDFCQSLNPDKPTCNLFTLKCVGTDTNTVSTTEVTTTKRISTTPACEDSVVGGAYDCKSHQDRCKDPLWLDLMRDKCKKTCGFCGTVTGGTTAPCKDLLSDCSKNSHLCKNSHYITFMKEKCRATCGFC